MFMAMNRGDFTDAAPRYTTRKADNEDISRRRGRMAAAAYSRGDCEGGTRRGSCGRWRAGVGAAAGAGISRGHLPVARARGSWSGADSARAGSETPFYPLHDPDPRAG